MSAHRARPAQFHQSSKNRVSMIAKIHLGRKQIALNEDDYRDQIREISGQESLKECSEKQLARILDWLKSKGFKPMSKKGVATHPMARKARAMWMSLYHLGAVQNRSEQALEAFAKRQLKCDRLVWARQSDANLLIEALKAWGIREGWQQTDRCTGRPFDGLGLKISLCCAILIKLKDAGAADQALTLEQAAVMLSVCAPGASGPQTDEDYHYLAERMGDVLRAQNPGAHAGQPQVASSLERALRGKVVRLDEAAILKGAVA